MSKDVNNLLRDLSRAGWTLQNGKHGVKAHHPDGGFVMVSRTADYRSLEKTRGDIRRLERANEEKKRQAIFHRNTGRPAVALTSDDWTVVTHPKDTEEITLDIDFPKGLFNIKENPAMPAKPEANDDRDSALLGLLSEMSETCKLTLGGVEAINRRIDGLTAALQSEATRREDESLYQQRLKFLDEKLKAVTVDDAAVISFTSDKELVEITKLVHAYGQKNSKQFTATRNDLKLVVVRVK
jgi:hypothetical protein